MHLLFHFSHILQNITYQIKIIRTLARKTLILMKVLSKITFTLAHFCFRIDQPQHFITACLSVP